MLKSVVMKLDKINKSLIQEYYKEEDTHVVFIYNVWGVFKILGGFEKDVIIVTNSKIIRAISYFLRMKGAYLKDACIRSQQYFAMKDAFLLLAKKKVPVYFFNRIGREKVNYKYSPSAERRMRKRLSFPVMYENLDKYEDDLKELFGNLYNKDYVKQIGRIPQVIQKGDVYCHEDFTSKYVNVIEGKRVVSYQPETSLKTIHIYGRCGAFGYAVEDKDSIPSQMQLYLSEKGYKEIKVVNHGLWGGTDEYLDHNFILDSTGFKEGDIIVFYRMHIDKPLLAKWEALGVIYKEITHEWHKFPEAKWCFYDKPGHMNNIGYKNVAKLMCDYLISNHFMCGLVDGLDKKIIKSDHLNDYLKNRKNNDFEKEIKEYVDSILEANPLPNSDYKCGSIVMNCNPFTKGHRYLIELAASKVERLYVFVVKEDKSFFKYEDRFEMVRQGTSDLDNVVVVSSGKFIISSLTFPEYFMKDYVKEKDFDVSMDVETFCKYIAPPLHIQKRFAGEEPFDPVTKNYNENMERILPRYGMEFCEIPRLSLDDKRVINATEVRRLLKNRDFETISEYVPLSTLKILKDKY